MEDHILHDHHHHHHQVSSSNSLCPNFPLQSTHQTPSSSTQLPPFLNESIFNLLKESNEEPDEEELGEMKEMMYKIAAMQPVDIDPSTIRKPMRRNVRISNDPQSVAARHRRERISEKIRILQRLVPGGTKMDTASMLDEAIRYVKFLRRQIKLLQSNQQTPNNHPPCINIQDWQVAYNYKASLDQRAAAATSSVFDHHQISAGLFVPNGNSNDHTNPMCFNVNNQEGISD